MLNRLIICLFMFLIISTGGEAIALELNSPSFNNDEYIPRRYSCQGEDVSPELIWSGLPKEAKSLALICEDPDAPVGTWVHWVIYDMPVSLKGLPEGVEAKEILKNGVKQGVNDFRKIGYGGPCPPSGGAHRYYFKLYCLDAELNLKPGLSKKELLSAMEGHVIEEIELICLYRRKIL